MEIDDTKASGSRSSVKAEVGRRTWYSLYVLDRLLSLQLGRPPAIHDDDCPRSLPSRTDEAGTDWENEEAQSQAQDDPSTGDYFLAVIGLSRIIGHV